MFWMSMWSKAVVQAEFASTSAPDGLAADLRVTVPWQLDLRLQERAMYAACWHSTGR